jgi:surface carbohydrate biosynthesis protein (TIGR04326 family)
LDSVDEDTVVVLVWNEGSALPIELQGCQKVYAECFDLPEDGISLQAYLDSQGESLRAAYVGFIHELGLQQVQGQTLAATLADQDGFSYWWMTHLAEKSPFKSPRIHDCLRLMALERLLQSGTVRARRLVLCGGDGALGRVLSSLCSRRGMAFCHQSTAVAVGEGFLRGLHRRLSWRVKGLLSLRHWLRRWTSRRLASPRWFAEPNGLLFCSYFFNLDVQKAESGSFYSRQWEELPGLLQREGWKLNWLHHLLLLPGVRSVGDALDKASSFNAQSESQGRHSFVESQLSVRLLAGALREWWLLGYRARRSRACLSFTPKGSQLDLWPLLEDDWETSLRGPIGLGNCIWRRLFDSALADLPQQEGCFYLWENQGWEAAFIYAWRRRQRAPIVGFPHATTAFWHLNNFDSSQLFVDTNGPAAKPLPDRLAVGGPTAWNMFRDSGYPESRMVEVEAVRFQHLLRQMPPAQRLRESSHPLRVLMLGDFSRQQSLAMWRCLTDAVRQWGGEVDLTVKPHPITPLDHKDLSDLSFKLSNEALAELLNGVDLAFASNTSSASLDAWLHGVPVAVFLDDASLNHSPMRGARGACFVRSGMQLAEVLAQGVPHPPMPVDQFFWLDARLSRWSRLVGKVAGQNHIDGINS